MRKIVIYLVTFIICFISSIAQAENRFYISIQAGMTYLEDAQDSFAGGELNNVTDLGVNAGVAIGFKMGHFRFEVEGMYHQNKLDSVENLDGANAGRVRNASDGDIRAVSYLANMYYDFDNKTKYTPYLGFGVGVAHVKHDHLVLEGAIVADDDDNAFAYKLAGGVVYELAHNIHLTAEYNYFSAIDVNLYDASGLPYDTEYDSHNLTLGARFIY